MTITTTYSQDAELDKRIEHTDKRKVVWTMTGEEAKWFNHIMLQLFTKLPPQMVVVMLKRRIEVEPDFEWDKHYKKVAEDFDIPDTNPDPIGEKIFNCMMAQMVLDIKTTVFQTGV